MNSVWDIIFPDLSDLIPCELSAITIRTGMDADVVSKCPLANRILCIVFMGSKPKMTRINTGPIVSNGAVVENTQSYWYGSSVQNPTRSMGENHMPTSAISVDLRVSIGECASNPQPTSFGTLDLTEKSTRETEIKTLRFQKFWSYVFLRGIHWMLRHAPGWLQASAGALSNIPSPRALSTK